MKAEFSDAYRMRNSVLVGLLAAFAVAGVGVLYGVKEVAGWIKSVWKHEIAMS